MDIIHLLPDSVANQIAAGEVIQRPASCLKELVENSLDAGAEHIRILVRDAGRTLLQVVDDGKGMSPTDARMAFERHATSKISSAQDLFSLRTMGFRGEALASICAVAQVEMQTRRVEDEVGALLEIEGSRVTRSEVCNCSVGTNIKVKNLFYNVPARRRFLKTDQTELRNLLNEFYHIALVYPRVNFTFASNEEVLVDLSAGTEKQRIEQVFGKGSSRSYTANLVDVRSDTDMVSIRGFVGKPETASRNAQQYFFVNGRFMRHPYFHKAIMTAFSGMLPGDFAPSYFIYFDINPEAIDVNIHPTKTEIKFVDEQAIFQILMAAVRESLGKFDIAPSLDFNRSGEIEMPFMTATPGSSSAPRVTVNPGYSPFRRETYAPQSSLTGWESLYQPSAPARTGLLFQPDGEELKPVLYKDRYILLPTADGLWIIDPRRAHQTVLYEQYMAQLGRQKAESQQVLFPEVMAVHPDQVSVLEEMMPDLEQLGFCLERLSKTEYSISGIPSVLSGKTVEPVVQNMLHEVVQTEQKASDGWRRSVVLSLSRDTAIPAGKHLTEEEMKDLITRLFALKNYQHTPDGKRVISVLSDEDIMGKFA